jgi:hypothetical protein
VAGGGSGGTGEEVREVYAAVPLAKFLILKGQARRPSILPVGLPYVGCILVALVLGDWLKGRESSKFQSGCFFWVLLEFLRKA